MKNPILFAGAVALAVQTGHSIPILSGDGIEPTAATGTFGATGRIFEYRLQGSAGLVFSATQSATLDALRLAYTFTAASAIAAASASLYLDADINQDANTWFNERGEARVAVGGASSWEIDEPGFGAAYVGDIYPHYLGAAFDNSVFNGQPGLAEDVALGLGFGFGSLGAGDQLLFEVLLSESDIGAGWGTVLHQWDASDGLSGDNLYLAGRYSIVRVPPPDPGPDPIPEPGTLALFALGLLGLGVWRLRRT